MVTEKFHTVSEVQKSISSLKEELDSLSRQREFLLSNAIPKLEHEYLYCISMLERESAKIEGELFRLSTIISFYEKALENEIIPESDHLTEMLNSLSGSWNDKINRLQYKSGEDHSIIPILKYERDEIAVLSQTILKQIAVNANPEKDEFYTFMLRRLSEAYRTGNIGELRALRIIVEGKQLHTLAKKKSFVVSMFQLLKFRIQFFIEKIYYKKNKTIPTK